MGQPQFPATNPVPSFWTATSHPLDDYQSSEKLLEKSDVLIIGSGYAGTATAYHLMRESSRKLSVTLLEARQICSGATGRNGGHLKPDTYFGMPRYSRVYGVQAAAEIAKFETSQVLAVKKLCERENLDCDFQLTRGLDVYLDESFARRTAEFFKTLVAEGVVDTRDVAYTGPENAERISGVKGAKACFSFTAGHLYPKKMVQQLLTRLVESGLQLHAHTAVQNISSNKDEHGYWTVHTNRGPTMARKIVYCTNAYTAALLPRYKDKIIPVRGICSHIETPAGKASPHLPNTYSLRFDNQQYDYLIPLNSGGIVVGGARKAFWHIKDSWYGNSNDAERVAGGTEYFDGYMQKYFRGWENSDAKLSKIWTGIMGYSSDFVPHLGQVPDVPGQYILAGFSGHGMPQILLASKAIARMIVEDILYEETGLPMVFKTTNERLETKKNELEEGFQNLWATAPAAKL